MLPGVYDLDLYRGDSYAWQFRLWEDDAKTDPADLTGVQADAEIRDKSAGTVIVPMTCTVVLPNTIDAALDPADTAGLPAKAAWDLQLTYPDGTVRTVLRGSVDVLADITDSVPVPATMMGRHRR